MTQDIRWKQRFDNFEKAFLLLRSVFEAREAESLSDLEQEGVVQRFEYTYELAWKTLKDYLEYTGIVLPQATPRAAVKRAFEAGLLADGQAWIDMVDDRNLMSHTYDRKTFERIIRSIRDRYLDAFGQAYDLLRARACDSD